MNYTGPKVRLSRKLGITLTPKAAKYIERKPYPPGQHGQAKRRMKTTDYAKQLLEKQKLRFQYNVSEKQLTNYWLKAKRMGGKSGDNLIRLLEARLDAAILRAGFAKSIYAARQYVSHGHFFVNGKRVNIPSYLVKVGDKIEVKEKSRKLAVFHDALKSSKAPDYIEVNKPGLEAKILRQPEREEIPIVCEIPMVVELYSK